MSEEPVISAGHPAGDWHKADACPEGLPEAAKGKLWVADIPEGMDLFYTLFDGERLLPRARSEGFNSTRKMGEDIGIFAPEEEKKLVYFPDGMLKNWKNLGDVEIFTYPTVGWTVNYLALEYVDEKNLVAGTSIPATYPVRFLKGRTPIQLPYGIWVDNVPESLDSPGEWMVTTRERKIWYWPGGIPEHTSGSS